MIRRLARSLPFRLNAGLILIYLCASGVVFYFFSLGLNRYLNHRLDEYLETEMLSVTSDHDFSMLPGNLEAVGQAFTRFGHSHGTLGAFMVLLSEHGDILASSDLKYFGDHDFSLITQKQLTSTSFLWETLELSGQPFRVITYQAPEGVILQIGFSMQETRELYASMQKQFAIALFSILVVGGFGGLIFGFLALKGLGQVREKAQLIRMRGDLNERVPTPTGSLETDELAGTMNAMLERIQDLVENLNYVMDNIAHDIRTPVTRMRGHAEMHLSGKNLSDREMEIAGQVIEECDQILNLVNILLEITAADSGLFQPSNQEIDAATMVRDGCELFEPVWESKEIQVAFECPDSFPWFGDPRILQRILSNLVDNAIKYCPHGGKISIELKDKDDALLLCVSDSGPGIDIHEQELVFQRFYRCQAARTQKGNGLGLSFCRSIAEAVGGSLSLDSELGKGSTFCLELPKATKT